MMNAKLFYVSGLLVAAASSSSAQNITTPSPPIQCPEFWTEYEGSCYRFRQVYADWFEAEDICIESGGHLVSITSEEENNFVRNFVEADWVQWEYWLGGQPDGNNGWKWSDGSEFEYSDFYEGTVVAG